MVHVESFFALSREPMYASRCADEEVRGLKTAAAVLEVRARACPAEPVDRIEGPDIQSQCRQCAIQQDVVPGVE